MRARFDSLPRVLGCLLAALIFVVTPAALARPEYLPRLPPTIPGCHTCHDNLAGGEGCRTGTEPCLNPFGQRFNELGKEWTDTLAGEDADDDGCTNGEELGDPDGDRMVEQADFCARSPGFDDSGALTECSRQPSYCCDDVSRAPLACECGASSLGVLMCEGLPPLPNDSHHTPTPLLDAHPTPFAAENATTTDPASSCFRGVRDIWFEYYPDCTGPIVIETDHPVELAVYGTRDLSSEITCQVAATRLEVPEGPLLIRVAQGGRGSITVSCSPTKGGAEVCANALPLTEDSRVRFVVDRERSSTGPQLTPERCPSEPENDIWYSYDASCTGRAVFDVALGPPGADPMDSECLFRSASLVLGSYPQRCPDRGTPWACLSETMAACGSTASQEVEVRAGERVYFKVGRHSGINDFVGELGVRCEPAVPTCNEHCVPNATCTATKGSISCNCLEGYDGDGFLPERGGSGCNREQLCLDAGFSCENGFCTRSDFDGSPICVCDDGYEILGETCRDVDDCVSEGPGIGACNVNGTSADGTASHSLCFDLEGSFGCACELGYSVDVSSANFDCDIVCGDGMNGPGEVCDDGNREPDDGCDSNCEIELGWECRNTEGVGQVSICIHGCGDGLIIPGEECDDENEIDDDECSNTCQLNDGCSCNGQPASASGFLSLLGVTLLWRKRRKH